MMQKLLGDYDKNLDIDVMPVGNLRSGKVVRNAVHEMNQSKFEVDKICVLAKLLLYPEGITDHDLAVELGLSLSSINGRRNDLINDGWDIIPVSIAKYLDSSTGKLSTLRCMWGIVS